MLELGLLFNQNENGEIILDVDELKAIVTNHIYFPKNATVQKSFLDEVMWALPEVLNGHKTLKEIVKEIYDLNGYEYACRIVEDSIIPLSADDYETKYMELEELVVAEHGSQLYSGAGLSDLNLDDIYNNICLADDDDAELLGGLIELEGLLEGKHKSGLKFEVYKFVETEIYVGYLI